MYLPDLLLPFLYGSNYTSSLASPTVPAASAALLQHMQRAASSTWSAVGCATDTPSRALTGTSTASGSNSVEFCENFCANAGYSYAGVEYSNECYCGNTLSNGAGGTAPSTDCNMACSGNSGEKCGGSYRLNLYTRAAAAASSSPTFAANSASTASGWTTIGCVYDGTNRALTGTSVNSGSNSVEYCESYCSSAGYTYAGVEYGNECWCGNTLANGQGGSAPSTDCNVACAGNSAETCGGSYRLNLYSRAVTTTTATATAPAASGWASLGCVTDSSQRALTGPTTDTSSASVEYCENFCAGYTYAGVEYGNECWCGNTLSNGQGTSAPSTDCSMACAGNSAETCGGSYRLNLYSRVAAGSTATPTSTTTTHATTTTAAPTASNGWLALGCVTDSSQRALTGPTTDTSSASVEYCENFCAGYSYAGVEYGNECWCGNTLSNGQGTSAPSTDCNMACAGNSAETCGGSYRLNLYSRVASGSSSTATATTTTKTTTTTTAPPTTTSGWVAVGCATDAASRALTGPSQTSAANSVESCESYCAGAGYTYAGVEYGDECYCGNSLSNGQGGAAPSTDCNMACAGNSAEKCGGSYRLNLYSHVGAFPTATATSTTTSAATATATSTGGNGVKYVVAHHMVGNTYPYAQSDWANDIALASAHGIDGFALNYGSDSWQPARLADAYAAALNYPNFRLFLSADMSSVSGNSASDASSLANQVKQFASHPNQLVYNGGVVLSTFSGETSYFGTGSLQAGWSLVMNDIGTPVTFLPAWFVDPSTFGNYPVLSGAFNWNGGWPTSNTDITFASDQQWLSGLNGKLYIAPVTPNFFTHYSPQTYNKNFIYRNDDNLYATRWEMLIQNRAQIAIAEIITWNDYGESHYIGPIEGAQPNSQAWVNGFDHQAWLDLTSFYAPAFKTGSYPAITNDKVYIYARPHPKDATACCDSVAAPTGKDNADDNFYAVVLATSAGSLILSTPPPGTSATPTSSSAGPSTFSVSAGINKFKLALVPNNGMRATLTRGSTTVLDVYPSTYTFNPSPQTYNFNAFVTMGST